MWSYRHLDCLVGLVVADIVLSTPLQPYTAIESGLHFYDLRLQIGHRGQVSRIPELLLDEERAVEILVQIAEDWTDLVTEALVAEVSIEFAETWPKCPLHSHAMDPMVLDTGAHWACRQDGRPVVPIGCLYAVVADKT